MYWRSRYRLLPSDREAPISITLAPIALSAILQFKRTSSVELRNVHTSEKRGREVGTGCLRGDRDGHYYQPVPINKSE